MTSFLIVDVETTGLDTAQHQLVEVGAVVFDADRGIPIASASRLVRADGNAAAAINRIPEDAVRSDTAMPPEALDRFFDALAICDSRPYYVAHNAKFDRQWLPPLDHGGANWICTYEDADWPRLSRGLPAAGTGSLHALALAYDVGIVRAHRAIEDCLTLAAVLSRVHELEGGLKDWLARALEPKREVIACVSYDDRQLAKDAGFGWDGARKLWTRNVRLSQVETFCGALPFRTRMGA